MRGKEAAGVFDSLARFAESMWMNIKTFFSSINIFTSILDILLVAFVIYSLIRLIRDSRAEQLIKGILLLGITYLFATVLNLTALKFLLNMLLNNALILIVVIFQPELRRILERVGQSHITGALSIVGHNSEDENLRERWETAITAACDATGQLQRQKMGALIVFERHTRLGEIIRTGTVVDADPSVELIGNIFFNKAPLHDGAMIMRDGRIHAAGCILPLTDQQSLSSSLGTRHRAAVGMSENSDALTVVVSEETGVISLASGGTLTSGYTPKTLHLALENGILKDQSGTPDGKRDRLLKKRRKRRDPE